MSRNLSPGLFTAGPAPFHYNGGESVGPGMDCLQTGSRQQPAGPFHYLINEQAKSLVALQELQNEVGALLEFRDLVMETFPNLRTKLVSSTPTTMTTHHHTSNIPISIRQGVGDWTPGVRIRKKITNKDDSSRKKSGDIANTIQDSGFSTETSSKETHSASSSAPPVSTNAIVTEQDDPEDELWNLLDLIHRKGTRLKDEVEALQGTLREQGSFHEGSFERVLFRGSADDVRQLRQERDLLLDRLAEMEAEVLTSQVQTSRLQEDLENLLSAKQDLEEQLKAVVSQRGQVNSRIHDLHSQFVMNITNGKPGEEGVEVETSQRNDVLDLVLNDRMPKVRVPDSRRIAAILREHDPLVLKKHLLKSTVQNQALKEQLESVTNTEAGLRSKLDKAREETDDLRFQLEDKNLELEGTRARVRVLEHLQKPLTTSNTSPDIIPMLEASNQPPPPSPTGAMPHVLHHNIQLTRTEISTPSMKAMSPLQMLDHTSSTESAHDQAESARMKRRPSKIPLKSYSAPKPPTSSGGKHSPAPGARSRSGGDSPARPHSAQSWRATPTTPKSRNSSLVSARDSLSSKLRSSDSLSKLSSSATSSPHHHLTQKLIARTSTPGGTSSTVSTEKVRSKGTSSIWNFFKLRDSSQT